MVKFFDLFIPFHFVPPGVLRNYSLLLTSHSLLEFCFAYLHLQSIMN